MEDVDAAYRLLLSIDKEFAEEVGKKYADDLQEMFRKGREQGKKMTINGKSTSIMARMRKNCLIIRCNA